MIDNLLKKLSTNKRKLSELSEEEQQEVVEMLDYYRSGKRLFWVIIAMGMFATAMTGIILFYKSVIALFK